MLEAQRVYQMNLEAHRVDPEVAWLNHKINIGL
jgi:hypothetical protein